MLAADTLIDVNCKVGPPPLIALVQHIHKYLAGLSQCSPNIPELFCFGHTIHVKEATVTVNPASIKWCIWSAILFSKLVHDKVN